MRKLILMAFICLQPFTTRAQKLPDSMFHWTYSTHKDEMSGELQYGAVVYSPDSLPMSNGNNIASLCFYVRGKIYLPMLSFLNGMISSSTTVVEVKFDDGPVEYFICTSSGDKLNAIVFTWSKGMLKRVLASHKVMFRVPFYQEGYQIVHFNIEGFKLPGT